MYVFDFISNTHVIIFTFNNVWVIVQLDILWKITFIVYIMP